MARQKGAGGLSKKDVWAGGKGLMVEVRDSASPPSCRVRVERPIYGPEVSLFRDSSGPVALSLLQNLISDADLQLVKRASDEEVEERMSLGFLQGILFAGEHSLRASHVRAASHNQQKELDDVRARHAELMEKLRATEARAMGEKASIMAELEEARKRTALAELESARLAEKAVCLGAQLRSQRLDAETLWEKKKEDFIKSQEFDALCSEKVLKYFELGFQGCLAQFRANGYSEFEHPASFLNLEKALEDMFKRGELSEEEVSEEES
ncbi:uncharacterized protein [Primulina eburnea]|uniref:uncharacterized protein n=1 Tax=Primulina eburnea TaxID=1245227 RepID=UPI003C6CB071